MIFWLGLGNPCHIATKSPFCMVVILVWKRWDWVRPPPPSLLGTESQLWPNFFLDAPLKVSPGECVCLLQWGQGLHCNATPRARILSGSLNWNILLISRSIIEKQLQKHFPGKQLKSFYISEDKTFPELDQFLSSSVAAYNLNNSVFQGKHLSNVIDFLNIPTGPLKPGLGRMIAEDPSIQATVCCLTCQIVVSSNSFGLFMGSLCFLIMFLSNKPLKIIIKGPWGTWRGPRIILHIHVLTNRWGLA